MFTCNLELPLVSEAISVDGDDADMTAICEIGYDDDLGARYAVGVAFTRDIGVERYSIRCWLLQRAADGHERSMWDGKETRAFVRTNSDRGAARAAVMACTKRLLETFRPARLELFTHSADLPEAALTKFAELADVFADAGYQVTREPPHYGRHAWIFEG